MIRSTPVALARARMGAAGDFGQFLGAADVGNIESVVWQGIRQAHQRARSNARMKGVTRGRFGALGESLTGTELAPIAIAHDKVPAIFSQDPRTVPIAETVKMAVDGCKALQTGSVVYAATSASTFLLRELFLSSDGADIDQTFAQTEGFAIAICAGEHGNFELYDFTGHQRGWEVLSEGYENGPIVLPRFIDFCPKLGADAAEGAAAPPLLPPD